MCKEYNTTLIMDIICKHHWEHTKSAYNNISLKTQIFEYKLEDFFEILL